MKNNYDDAMLGFTIGFIGILVTLVLTLIFY